LTIAIENQYFVLFLLNFKELGITFWKIEWKDMPGMRRFATKAGTAFVGAYWMLDSSTSRNVDRFEEVGE